MKHVVVIVLHIALRVFGANLFQRAMGPEEEST